MMSKINLLKIWLTNRHNNDNNNTDTDSLLNINFEEICRFCLSSENNLNYKINHNINVNSNSEISLIDIIMNFMNIQVLTDDNLPQNLCENCFNTIWNAYVYQEQCKESNTILISYLNVLQRTAILENQLRNESNKKTIVSENENHSNILSSSSSLSSDLNKIDQKHHESIDNVTTTWLNSECDQEENPQVTIEYTNYKIINNNTTDEEQIKEREYYDDNDNYDDSFRIQSECDDITISSKSNSNITTNNNLKSKLNKNKSSKSSTSCSICQQTFTNSKSLARHNKLHQTNTKNKLCTFCGKCFVRTDDLKRHIRTHTGECPYGCDQCPKKFKQISELKEHKQTHLNEKIYVCTICGKSLATRNGLYIHMKIHLGIKKHECQLCHRKYVTSSELTSHIRHIHSKEKPFTCNYTNCIRSFTTKLSLQSHLVAHIGAKPFKCNDCGKSYATVSSLQVHKRLHTNTSTNNNNNNNNNNNRINIQLKVICSICDRQFGSDQSLARHLRNTHNLKLKNNNNIKNKCNAGIL